MTCPENPAAGEEDKCEDAPVHQDCGWQKRADSRHEPQWRQGPRGQDDHHDVFLPTDASLQIRTGHLTELEIATVVNTYLLPLVKVLHTAHIWTLHLYLSPAHLRTLLSEH